MPTDTVIFRFLAYSAAFRTRYKASRPDQPSLEFNCTGETGMERWHQETPVSRALSISCGRARFQVNSLTGSSSSAIAAI
ncbi:hypothetical protein D1872_280990 [compost metagenome]